MMEKLKISKMDKKQLLLAVLIVCLMVVTLTGGLIARYVTRNERQAEMIAADFHFSSNYLKEAAENAEYTVADWANQGIDIMLYNYETENIALVAEEPITYEVTVDSANWEISLKEDGTDAETKEFGKYVYQIDGEGSQQKIHLLHLHYSGSDTPQKVTVMVKTIEPYINTYKAVFTLQGKSAPQYKIVNQSTYVTVTIYANDYDGEIEVQWDAAKFSPDNTNPYWNDEILDGSTDTTPSGTLNVQSYHTYELIFVKKTTETFEKDLQTATSGNIVEVK